MFLVFACSCCLQSGADSVHPGYGFLSENPYFVKRLEDEGILFIGPLSTSIHGMGSKISAKTLAKEVGVPAVPGIAKSVESMEEVCVYAAVVGLFYLLLLDVVSLLSVHSCDSLQRRSGIRS